MPDVTTLDEVVERLSAAGIRCSDPVDLPNGQRQVEALSYDAVVNVWENGTCNVQGAGEAPVREVLGDLVGKGRHRARPGAVPAPIVPPVKNPDVFVVYGHDADARTQLEAMLRRWNCEPLILDQLPSEGATIIEKLGRYQATAGFGVVLATPDDSSPTDGLKRARQNVVLELGMLLQKLGRDRVAILLKNPSSMERPSDIDGLIYLSFTDDVEEIKVSLAKEMQNKGFTIDVGRL